MEKWRVQATSADGHGVNLDFTVPLTGITATTAESTPRWLLAMLGLSLIFGIFGLIQLLAKKKA
jgi:predicted phage tail protein